MSLEIRVRYYLDEWRWSVIDTSAIGRKPLASGTAATMFEAFELAAVRWAVLRDEMIAAEAA